jgi:hypothetical protein
VLERNLEASEEADVLGLVVCRSACRETHSYTPDECRCGRSCMSSGKAPV